MSPVDFENKMPCTCAGMNLFSQDIKPGNLKKPAQDIKLPKNLPTQSTDVASYISGVQDESLKQAQTSAIGIALTQEQIAQLPEAVRNTPQMMAASKQLADSQNQLFVQMAEVQSLNEKMMDSRLRGNDSLRGNDIEAYKKATESLNQVSKSTNAQLAEVSKTIEAIPKSPEIPSAKPNAISFVVPAVTQVAAGVLLVSLSQITGQSQFLELIQGGMAAIPAIPATPKAPNMPAVPSIPAFGPSFEQNGISYVTVPSGLFATPEMPAMPAFPGAPAMPAIPATSIDMSALPKSADLDILGKAAEYSKTQVNIADIAKYFPESSKQKSAVSQSAFAQTPNGLQTKPLDSLPAIPARPELPALPATADLSSWAGLKIPTPPSLQANLDKFTPAQASQYSAFWTDIQGKFAASQRSSDGLKEAQAGFQQSMQKLVDAQKAANEAQMPLSVHLAKTSGTSPVFAATDQQMPSFLQKFSNAPKTPTECTKVCVNANKRNLFPDLSSPEQFQTAEFFSNPNELVSKPGTSVISTGPESGGFVNAHISNLENQVKASGGKVATIQAQDLHAAVHTPEGMTALESKLNGSSLVTIKDVQNLSPQESVLLSNISKTMGADVPVLVSTPSIGQLSSSPEINTALIEKLAPSGSKLDARLPFEVPKTSVYTKFKEAESNSFVSSFFKKQKI